MDDSTLELKDSNSFLVLRKEDLILVIFSLMAAFMDAIYLSIGLKAGLSAGTLANN